MAALASLARSSPLLRRSTCSARVTPRATSGRDAWTAFGGSKDPYQTNLGVYQGDSCSLHFPPVKTGSLKLVNQKRPGEDREWKTTYAEPWFLRIISMTHYSTFATQVAVALAYFSYSPPQKVAIPFLLVAGPLFQAMGGAGPNVMHEYEGFQKQSEYNNDALRQVAYRSLFQLQAVGAAMFGIGALWQRTGWSIEAAWGTLGALALILYLCPRTVYYWRTTFFSRVELLWPPLPVYPLIFFFAAAFFQAWALVNFFQPLLGGIITALLVLGGLLEAGIAEGTYDQRWHLLAVIMLNAGGWLQVAAIREWHVQPVITLIGLVLSAYYLPALCDLIKKFQSDPPSSSTPSTP